MAKDLPVRSIVLIKPIPVQLGSSGSCEIPCLSGGAPTVPSVYLCVWGGGMCGGGGKGGACVCVCVDVCVWMCLCACIPNHSHNCTSPSNKILPVTGPGHMLDNHFHRLAIQTHIPVCNPLHSQVTKLCTKSKTKLTNHTPSYKVNASIIEKHIRIPD